MSTTKSTTIRLGTRVRISSPYVRDYSLTGVITDIQYGISFYIQLDSDGTWSGPYGADELAIITDTPVTPRLSDVNWSRFVLEAEAIARQIEAATPGITAREAGDCAAQQVEANYAAELARTVEFNSDAMIADAHNPDGSPRHALPTVYEVPALLDSLVIAVDAARQAAAGNSRWVNAINAGFDHLLQVEVIEVDAHDALIYRSESGATYRANGSCQCVAFAQGQPCKHRAAARLVHNALHA